MICIIIAFSLYLPPVIEILFMAISCFNLNNNESKRCRGYSAPITEY